MATFTDDFNRANTSDLGAGWVEVSGDWSIVSNQLSPGAAGGTIILRAAGAMASSDNFAQFTVAATTSASQGIWCRGNANISSGYLWRNDGSNWTLFRVLGGSFTSIGSYAAAAAPGDVARVQAVGSTIKAFVNGVERVSITDTDVATGTSVGIRSESVGALRFDDFNAGDVTAGASLGNAAATESAQSLTGTKTVVLSIASATHEAQPVTGSKAGTLSITATAGAAQTLTGLKAAALDTGIGAEAAQPLTGSKTALLAAAAHVEIAQPLTLAASLSLAAAAAAEVAQTLTGAKSATLSPVMETSTARTLTPAGADEDVDVAVGAPYSPWSTGALHRSGWEVGAPW